MRPVHGVAGQLGHTSDDGRRIDPAGFRVRRLPLPLMALERGPGPGHDGARLAGRLDRVLATADGLVHVTGATDLPPGEYGCGFDLARCELVLLDPETGGPGTDVDGRDLVHLITAGELIAVTAYPDGSPIRPAFPAARLVVEA